MIDIDHDIIKYLKCIVKTNGNCIDAIKLLGKNLYCENCIVKYIGNCNDHTNAKKIAEDLLQNPEKLYSIIFDNNL